MRSRLTLAGNRRACIATDAAFSACLSSKTPPYHDGGSAALLQRQQRETGQPVSTAVMAANHM
ncbi:MAG TPA: hypothetical protein DCM53_03775, partial [Enterobacteriaceae bacterium]|nr:hypothetical protein [Enterobacteriaceae bacterium]